MGGGSVEYGICEICGKETFMQRTYFRYDFKCECHSPYHFNLVRHCKDCVPDEPQEYKIYSRKKKIIKIISC